MRNTLMRPGRLFLICLSVLLYAANGAVLLGVVAPALVSSTDSVLVCLGFLAPAVWLIGTGCLALQIVLKIRACAEKTTSDTTLENDQ